MKFQSYSLLFIFVLSQLIMTSCSQDAKSNAEPPNILFAIADDASFPHMGAYGSDWVKTPAFDRIAEQGILFMNAYTPNAKCAPSRSCILTGRNSWQLEQAANHSPNFPAKFKTFAEVLDENGYHVGYTAKGWEPGNAGTIDGKKRDLLVKRYSSIKLEPPTTEISKIDYTANFQKFLAENEESKPFFFWYGSYEPHRRYEFMSSIKKGGKSIAEMDSVFSMWPQIDSVKIDMLDYAFEIEYFDQHLQKMLRILEEEGKLDNTLVIVTADNGMPFPRIKGQGYELSNHLPLAIMWPDGIENPGRVVEDFVNFIDFAPTFLELAGISEDKSGMKEIEGKSLTGIFNSDKDGIVEEDRDHVLIGKERHDVGRPNDWGYPIRGIVKGDFLYIKNYEPNRWPAGNPETGYLNCDGSPTKTTVLDRRTTDQHYYWEWNFGKRPTEEMYNIKNDPLCMVNLADEQEYQELKDELKNQMISELKTQEDPRMFGNGEVFENYTYGSPSTRNFYERYMSGENIKAGWVNPSDFEKKPLD